MRLIARSTLAQFAEKHPETRASLSHWVSVAPAAAWSVPERVPVREYALAGGRGAAGGARRKAAG